MSHELRDAIRLLQRAIEGNPWTGQLDKHEVKRAANKLIDLSEQVMQENERLKRGKT